MGAVASGIALVVAILVLNLTTAVGTLNGLIFYVNIVALNNVTYYNHMSKPNIICIHGLAQSGIGTRYLFLQQTRFVFKSLATICLSWLPHCSSYHGDPCE
jgi:hypothetical protein